METGSLKSTYESAWGKRASWCSEGKSAYYDPIEGLVVRKHPRIWDIMTGIFNKTPPVLKYSFVWDVEKVLRTLGDLNCKILTINFLKIF